MVTRSKAAWQAKNNRVSDTTYHTNITPTPTGRQHLHNTLTHHEHLRATDLSHAQAHYNTHGHLPTRETRTTLLQANGTPNDIARAIVEKNNTLIENAIEAATTNIAKWETERDAAPPKRKHKYQGKINKAQTISICLGGKHLFKQAQKDPTGTLMNQWRDKRQWHACSGTTGRPGGNRQIKLSPTNTQGTYTLKMNAYHPDTNTYAWENIGHATFKRGYNPINNALEARAPLSIELGKKGKHYTIHVTPSASPESFTIHTPTGNNHAGFDLNSHHYEYTITDPTANPLGSDSITFSHAGEEMDKLVAETFRVLYERGVKSVSIERLKGINRAKGARETGHAAPGVRRAVNGLPVRLFFEAVRRNARKYGMELLVVSPAGTSRDTKFWPELMFGSDVHGKASYLIARRGLGYSLVGRRGLVLSGRRRMSAPGAAVRGSEPIMESGCVAVEGGAHPAAPG